MRPGSSISSCKELVTGYSFSSFKCSQENQLIEVSFPLTTVEQLVGTERAVFLLQLPVNSCLAQKKAASQTDSETNQQI